MQLIAFLHRYLALTIGMGCLGVSLRDWPNLGNSPPSLSTYLSTYRRLGITSGAFYIHDRRLGIFNRYHRLVILICLLLFILSRINHPRSLCKKMNS